MKRLFLDTRPADALCRERFGLTEEIMMENAAAALEHAVMERCGCNAAEWNVLVLCGSGNNGADGYALARRLAGKVSCVCAMEVRSAKSELCLLQKERAVRAGVKVLPFALGIECRAQKLCVVDCIFGSGFYGELPAEVKDLLCGVNALAAVRIACDVPTGLDSLGNAGIPVFCADMTVTMGALKLALFSDAAKDFCGTIVCAELGVGNNNFEQCASACENAGNFWLLEKTDMQLPVRSKQNVNKGSFGHAAFVSGEKPGASAIAACAALRFGAGLCTLVSAKYAESAEGALVISDSEPGIPSAWQYEVMRSGTFPLNTTAVALGMGLGKNPGPYYEWLLENSHIPCVLDADVCACEETLRFLECRIKSCGEAGVVLTPHPKEFSSLLKICGMGSFTVEECVTRRLELTGAFCKKFQGVVLVLKGANVFIAKDSELFINPYGTSKLSKAGSGDVLAGLVAALLAQRKTPLESAINASLAHALASTLVKTDFSLTPFGLIQAVSQLN